MYSALLGDVDNKDIFSFDIEHDVAIDLISNGLTQFCNNTYVFMLELLSINSTLPSEIT